MGMPPRIRSIGVTVKFVIQGDEELVRRLLDTLPSDLTIAGADLSSVRVGIAGYEVEPVRVGIRRQGVTTDMEDDFLENG
jgi:hypothetical protein